MGKKNYSRIELKLDKQKKYIEKELKKVLAEISAPKILKEVMLYSVFNGGKRIRPFIIAEVSSIFSVNRSIYKYPALAIEMAHSFSLIYDDLPCMDDDDLRRGKPAVHVKFNLMKLMLCLEDLHY